MTNVSLPDGVVGLGRFATRRGSSPFVGAVIGEHVVPMRALLPDGPQSMDDFFSDWRLNWSAVRESVENLSADELARLGCDRDGLTVLTPLTHPQILQSGANYRKHVIDLMVSDRIDAASGDTDDEVARRAAAITDERVRSGQPYVFVGLPSALCGAEDDIVLPRHSDRADWELELAVVLGSPARHVTAEDAHRFIAGYTIANDLTLRDLVRRSDLPVGTDWMAGKNSPTFLPLGPVIVPSEYVPDPMDVRITLSLNGEVMQDESTADMLFDIGRLIAFTSAQIQLMPGDVLLTGSPAGNGAPRGRFLRAGDLLESTITGLGTQTNRCVNETVDGQGGPR